MLAVAVIDTSVFVADALAFDQRAVRLRCSSQ
jgi:hypothetical protein